jgi:hypothetical protein
VYADLGQVAAAGQQKGAPEDVGGFQSDQKITSLKKDFSSPIRDLNNESVTACQAPMGIDYHF